MYLCLDRELDRPVAVKVLHRMVAGEVSRERFRREATAAARLRHPHVLQVFDQGHTTSGDPFLVSEYVEGPSLDVVLREQHRIEPDRARRWLEQVAEGLAAAHQAGVVHRDVKPANIMLRGEEALVGDFGLALMEERTGEVLESLTRTGQSVGTPLYMAPEVVGGSPASRASDVWALGALGYRMLYGREWRSADMSKLVLEARTLPRAAQERFGNFPVLDEALRGALHGDPADRLSSMEDFLEVLRGDAPAEPAPPAPPAPGRLRLALPGLVVLAAVAGLTAGYLSNAPPEAPVASPSPSPELASPTEEPASLRRARRALELAGPNPRWDSRRRSITRFVLELSEPFLEPTAPLALGRLVREAEAARAAGAPLAPATRALARFSERLGLAEDYVPDALVSEALERGSVDFDSDAWRQRVEEMRTLGRGALARFGRERGEADAALALALRGLAAAPDVIDHAMIAARQAARASPRDAELLIMVATRVLRRQLGTPAEQLDYTRVLRAFLQAVDRPSPDQAKAPAMARARSEVLEATCWLLRVTRASPSPEAGEIYTAILELSWRDREAAAAEVAAGYGTIHRWLKPRGFFQDSENPYAKTIELVEQRSRALGHEPGRAPLVPDPSW